MGKTSKGRSPAKEEARIDRRYLGEFGVRVAGPMSNEDSNKYLADPEASKLDKPHRVVLFDEERPGRMDKFRPYTVPENEFLSAIAHAFATRGNTNL